ncbi:hypothetical protein ABZP36_006429 [Zizania latifolia]
MDKALTKIGSFTISRKAKQELSAIGDDISRFSSTVEEKAKWVFDKLKGMKTKVVVWVKVASISMESFRSDKVCFMAGVKKLRQKDAYEVPREAISVEEF